MIKRRPGTQFIRELTGEEIEVFEDGGRFTVVDGQITLVPENSFVTVGQRFTTSDIEAIDDLAAPLESIAKK